MAQLRNPHPGEIVKEEFLNETAARTIPRDTSHVSANVD
jgi:plasmid maintenance system antidote protein VapI